MSEEKQEKKMYAYTPGLKVKKNMTVIKSRILPIFGDTLVKVGDKVNFNTVVAKALTPGEPEIIPAAARLGVTKNTLFQYMLKKKGDILKEGELICKNVFFFGLFKRMIYAPFDSTLESVSDISGRIILRGAPIPIEIKAYIQGTVVEVIPKQGVVIETEASFIQGIFGIGGETFGEIRVIDSLKDSPLTEEQIAPEHKGKILVGGTYATVGAIKKSIENGVKGIVTGGIRSEDLKQILGFDIGVAITGEEDIQITLIATESFGEMPIADHTLEILKKLEGRTASINGATQIRAGVMRPEIIVPDPKAQKDAAIEAELDSGMMTGTRIRAIRAPFFGQLGVVKSLPVGLEKLETESFARVVEIELDNGITAILPRANVELIVE